MQIFDVIAWKEQVDLVLASVNFHCKYLFIKYICFMNYFTQHPNIACWFHHFCHNFLDGFWNDDLEIPFKISFIVCVIVFWRIPGLMPGISWHHAEAWNSDVFGASLSSMTDTIPQSQTGIPASKKKSLGFGRSWFLSALLFVHFSAALLTAWGPSKY